MAFERVGRHRVGLGLARKLDEIRREVEVVWGVTDEEGEG